MTPRAQILVGLAKAIIDEEDETNDAADQWKSALDWLKDPVNREDLLQMYDGRDDSWDECDDEDITGMSWELLEMAADELEI